MPEPLSLLTLLNLIVTVAIIVGGAIAYRYGFTSTANEVQERVINALQSEIEVLQDRLSGLEEENAHLNHIITTLCTALKQSNIHVTIEGNTVSVHDYNNNSHTCHMREKEEREEKIQNPPEHPQPRKPSSRKRYKKAE